MKKIIIYSSIFTVIGIGIFVICYSLYANKKNGSDYNVDNVIENHAKIAATKSFAPDISTNSFTSDKIIKIDSVETYEKVSKYGKLANCLSGTDIDGELKVDKNGKLIISKGIVYLFEYFMSARNEESFETCIARIREYIQLTLPYDAQNEALSILNDYLNYKEALDKVMSRTGSSGLDFDNIDNIETIERARNIMQERNNLRRQFLKPEVAEAFFSDEEAYDKFVLDRVSLEQNNPSFTEDEKLKMIEKIASNNKLPESFKQKVIFKEKEKLLENKITALREQGDNEDTIYELRQDLYGKEIADGLTANDKTRQDWENRFNAYYEIKKAILNSKDLQDYEKQMKINQLQQKSFTNEESSLLALYESVEEEKMTQMQQKKILQDTKN